MNWTEDERVKVCQHLATVMEFVRILLIDSQVFAEVNNCFRLEVRNDLTDFINGLVKEYKIQILALKAQSTNSGDTVIYVYAFPQAFWFSSNFFNIFFKMTRF